MQAGWLVTEDSSEGLILRAGGAWIIDHAGGLDRDLHAILDPLTAVANRPVTLDLGQIEQLDTTGAWLLYRTERRLADTGAELSRVGDRSEFAALIDQVSGHDGPVEIVRPQWNPIVRILHRTGQASFDFYREMRSGLGFAGLLTAAIGRVILHPSRFRLTATVLHMERVGINALPIVCLVSFLIGVVMAFQGVDQLRRFGVEIFVVNMVAVSVLREIGILLTAIVVAGRSGSAFAAEIGTMVVNEEVDAMRTLGLDPIEVLVLPRMMALMIMLPILAFISDMMGLLGGMVICWVALDITPRLYLDQMRDAVDLWTFWIGIIKAPVFAALIGITGCYHGLQVTKTAASVGERTTTSVVFGIFAIIVADAAFSIMFSFFGI